MHIDVLTQTIISGFLASAAMLAFLLRFGPRRPHWPQIVAAVIFLDQASKWIVARALATATAANGLAVGQLAHNGPHHSYLGGAMEVGYYANYLQGFGGTSAWLLCATLVSAVASVRLYQMLAERGYRMSFATEGGLALVLGGVAALAAERACAGFVVDFLQFGARSNYVFNFADLVAFGGALILFVRAMIALPGLIERELAGAGGGVQG